MRHRHRRPPCAGDRARARQRRPRTPGGVLHRLAGHDEHPHDRLRHPLRVRDLPSGLRRRAAGRAAGRLAPARLAVGLPAPRGRADHFVRGAHRDLRRRRRRAHPLGSRVERPRGALQHDGSRLPQRPGEHPAPVAGGGDERVRPAHVQLGRLRRIGARADLRGEHLQGPLPRGLHPQGKELRLQQQYFFVAASIADFVENVLPEASTSRSCRAGHLPAQRHAPRDRRARTHARAHRREAPRVGCRVGDHAEVLRVHVPHAAARSPGGVVGRSARAAAAAAPGDHLPHQRRVPARGARALRRRRDADPRHVDHRRAPVPIGADGLLGHGRGLEGQRCRRAALAAAARQRVEGLREDVAREVHQRHQRGHAAPVPAAREPRALVPHHRDARCRLDGRPRTPARTRGLRRRPRVPRALRRGQGGQQAPTESRCWPRATAPPSTTGTCWTS